MATGTIYMPKVETLSGTTGSDAYSGYYYANLTTSQSTGKIESIVISQAQSNRPCFAIITEATQIRVYSPLSNTTVSVRVTYR